MLSKSKVFNAVVLSILVAGCTGKESAPGESESSSEPVALKHALPKRLSCANDFPSTWEAGMLHIDFGAGGRPASVLIGNQKMYVGQVSSDADPEKVISVNKVVDGSTGMVSPFPESITVLLEERVSENQYIVSVSGRTPMLGSTKVACLGMDE
jgi:hypothetical protein